MDREDDVIELGTASVQTQGDLNPLGDDVGGINPLGLAAD